MKDLYVRQDRRGSGLGRALMSRLAKLAQIEGIARIDWTADADDTRLQEFCAVLGGAVLPEKLFFRIGGEKLKELASG